MKLVFVLISFVSLALFGAGCSSSKSMISERIVLKTSDRVEIVGTYRNTGQSKIAILLHMMPMTKESWDEFATRLLEVGYASVAIDERGHGESTMNGTLDYKKFTNAQQQAKRLDVEAAIAFAKANGFLEDKMVVIGASIGANLAIQALVDHPDIPFAVALSPGLDYHGVKTDSAITKLRDTQKVVLVASDDDSESFKSVFVLQKNNPSQTILIKRSGLGHGTWMTDKDPKLVQEVLMELP
jgi:alpha-beta hydrolase superfamily lysophospholipase